MNVESFLANKLAQPITHRVVTEYADGRTRALDVRGGGAAETYAVGERRKIGRALINRETGATVSVVAVHIEAIN